MTAEEIRKAMDRAVGETPLTQATAQTVFLAEIAAQLAEMNARAEGHAEISAKESVAHLSIAYNQLLAAGNAIVTEIDHGTLKSLGAAVKAWHEVTTR
jgi:hypothetical protein